MECGGGGDVVHSIDRTVRIPDCQPTIGRQLVDARAVSYRRVKSNALGTIGGFHSIKKLTSLVWKALWTDYLSRYHLGASTGDPGRGGRGGGG